MPPLMTCWREYSAVILRKTPHAVLLTLDWQLPQISYALDAVQAFTSKFLALIDRNYDPNS